MISHCTPAHAASSTSTARAVRATAKFARPKKRILNPAAVDPARLRRANPIAVVTALGVGKQTSDTLFKGNMLDIHDSPPRSSRTAGALHGIFRFIGAVGHGQGTPQPF